MVIMKLKERIKSLSGNIKEEKIKQELEEIESINIELDHREKVLVITALKDTLRKLKGKVIVDEVVILHPINPELLKINVAPLAPKLQNNRTAHYDYLKHTQKENMNFREIVEHERSLNPLNTSLDYSCNTKKDKIQQTPSSSKKNKLEAYPRNVITSLQNKKSVVNIRDIAYVQESKLNVNFDLQCVSKSKINKSLSANEKEPNKSWRSTISNVPSSSVDDCGTMDMTIDQQVALDEALVPYATRLRIKKAIFATTTVHHHSICFKMNIKKRIVNIEYFREMLHICPRIPNQTFDELPFEEEILAFLRNLGYNGEIKKITDVNINKLHQPWRSFAAVINKCISEKSTAYKEYYAIASGAAPPKTKASVRKTQSSSDTTMTPPTAAGTRLSTSIKGKQPTKSSKAKGLSVISEAALTEAKQMKLATKRSLQQTLIFQASGSGADEGTVIIPGILDIPTYDSDEEISWMSCNDDESHGMNVGGDEGPNAKDDDEELYGDVNINMEGRDVHMIDVHTTQVLKDIYVNLTPVNPDGQQQSSSVSSQFVSHMLSPSPDAGIDSLFESTPRVDVPVTTTVVPLLVTTPTQPSPSIPIISQVQQAPALLPTTAPRTSLVDRYIDHQMNEAVKVAVQLQSDRLQDEAQAKNEDFRNKLDENIQKIIKEQVKEQVKVQVSKILPKIEKIVNEQLKAEVLTRASNSSKTSYVVAADLSELELRKILIENIESNKSIHRSNEQRNLCKALVDAYECDRIILDTYGDTLTLKIRRDDEDKDEEPSAGSDWGSKRRRAGKEPESTSAPKEKTSKTSGKSREGFKSYQKTTSESALAKEPMHTTLDEPSHQEFETGAAALNI
uniref:Retrovirus-related Pol polyprotein from transposon TNT 1-94 n=1 Tax=Tanacetum cinerariifolium TaxID=118510 RepID=A0A699GVZ0_TANCI|nr:hypothetical protein [Tanacetum cinerariifolium]